MGERAGPPALIFLRLVIPKDQVASDLENHIAVGIDHFYPGKVVRARLSSIGERPLRCRAGCTVIEARTCASIRIETYGR